MLQLISLRINDGDDEWDGPILKALLELAVGNPTPERLESTREWYAAGLQREMNIVLLGERQIGLLGTELLPDWTLAIRHLAIAPDFQGKGHGRWSIEELSRRYPDRSLLATTDLDAVEFYRRCGFRVHALGQNSYGRERFDCRRDRAWVSS